MWRQNMTLLSQPPTRSTKQGGVSKLDIYSHIKHAVRNGQTQISGFGNKMS